MATGFSVISFRRDNERAFAGAGLSDTGDSFVVKAFVPGLDEKALTVSLNNEILTLQGDRTEDALEGYVTHRRERATLRFQRTFAFPTKVDPDKVSAELKDGVLTVTVAKSADVKPRAINIKAA